MKIQISYFSNEKKDDSDVIRINLTPSNFERVKNAAIHELGAREISPNYLVVKRRETFEILVKLIANTL